MVSAERAAALAVTLAGEGRLALGCMGIAGVYGHVDGDEARATIHSALDAGVILFDTAPLYGDGLAENLLGEVVATKDAAVVTKFGLMAAADGSLIKDSRPASVRLSVEQSLRRLRRECVDVLLQHRPDPSVPDDAVAEILLRLVEEGKARFVGLSACPLARAVAFPECTTIAFVQNEFSASSVIGKTETPASFASKGIAFMAHSPLGRGLLAQSSPRTFEGGDYREKMPNMGHGAQTEAVERARARGVIAGEVDAALDWVLAQGPGVIAVVGVRTPIQARKVFGRAPV